MIVSTLVLNRRRSRIVDDSLRQSVKRRFQISAPVPLVGFQLVRPSAHSFHELTNTKGGVPAG